MRVFMVMLATLAVLLALIANLLLKPKATAKMATLFGWGANVLGFLLYGYGYAVLESNVLMAVLKTIYAVFGMFLGKDSMGDMKALPFFDLAWVKMLLYLAQMFALYITASAAIAVFGANLLNRIRVFMARFGKISLIYGINEDTLRIGKALSEEDYHVVFIGDGGKDESTRRAINQMRAVYVNDAASLSAAPKFLQRFSIGGKASGEGGRPVAVFAISKDTAANVSFAEKLRVSLEKAGVDPSTTRLTLYLEDGYDAAILQNSPKAYGYGSVLSFDAAELSARMMTLKCPPYKTMTFDSDGKATTDFHAMVVGFGKAGQAALKQLLMNGQFYGSNFHLMVYDPSIDAIDGYFRFQHEALFEHYDIALESKDGRSLEAFEFLHEHASSLKYVVIATGDDSLNQEISLAYAKVLNELHCPAVMVAISTAKGSRVWYADGKLQTDNWPVFSKEVIDSDVIDERAKILNHYYMNGNGKSKEENWASCDYFSRQSSRASADFMDAFLAMAGKELPAEETAGGAGAVAGFSWDLSNTVKENLGRTEHDRWMAFHYAHGYRPMTKEEWQKRAEQYLKEKKETGKASIRIGKDTVNKCHACIIPWEELPELDERENAVTGGHVEYQKMDITNVMIIPELAKVKS